MWPEKHKSGAVEVPAPTPWPFVTAFGLALIFASVIKKFVCVGGGVGLFFVVLCWWCFGFVLAGAVVWFRVVMPVQQEESVKVVRPLSATVTSSTRRVDHLEPGAGG